MSVQMICPNLRCRKILSVPDDARGKIVKCQHCQTTFRVPDAQRPPNRPHRRRPRVRTSFGFIIRFQIALSDAHCAHILQADFQTLERIALAGVLLDDAPLHAGGVAGRKNSVPI